MKKIVRQQNYLKELIESQENQFLSKLSLKSIIRGVLEPLLDNPEEGVVLYRINDKSGILGLLTRIEYSSVSKLSKLSNFTSSLLIFISCSLSSF